MELIGRKVECNLLKNSVESDSSELIAVYGRRRIGKTFLIRQYFKDKFAFYTTGIYEGTKSEQLSFFNRQLNTYAKGSYPPVRNWFDAFDQLKHHLSHCRQKAKVVFIDELPWMDTPRSRFLKAFETFWNSWGSTQTDLKLIVCGSATTWMTDKFLKGKGGLHGRVTRNIPLEPFSLLETEQFLEKKKIRWNRRQILDCYMVFGGVPYYLSLLQKNLSLDQNVDALFYSSSAQLKNEYDFLFQSLFSQSEAYKSVIALLAKKSIGMSRQEILRALKLPDGGSLTEILNDLCNCDFIRKYSAFGKVEREAMFQLTDLFSLFYLRFVKRYNGRDAHHWTNMLDTPVRNTWRGYAFEQVCLLHIPQIKKALGINGIQSDVSSWYSKDKEQGAQIDLLIDRRDQTINLCEMKYAAAEYEITRAYHKKLMSRRELFRKQTKTRKALYLTMITTHGISRNRYAGDIQSEVTMEELFNTFS